MNKETNQIAKKRSKTKRKIELTPFVAIATAIIPSLAGGASAIGGAAENPDAIRPFHVQISEQFLADLRQRIAWEEPELIATELRAAFRSLR